MDAVAYAESDLPEWIAQLDRIVDDIALLQRYLLDARQVLVETQRRTNELTDIDSWWDLRDAVKARLGDTEQAKVDLAVKGMELHSYLKRGQP